MNEASKLVYLTTLAAYIESALHQGHGDLARMYIKIFNQITGVEYSTEEFLTYYLHTDLKGFVSRSLLGTS